MKTVDKFLSEPISMSVPNFMIQYTLTGHILLVSFQGSKLLATNYRMSNLLRNLWGNFRIKVSASAEPF